MNGPEHFAEAERLIGIARGAHEDDYADTPVVANRLAEAQVHATLAQAAATERLAAAVENLPTYEGMLSVYNFGGGKS